MWEINVEYVYYDIGNRQSTSIQDLLESLIKDRRKYAYSSGYTHVGRIYSFIDINGVVQLGVCEYPWDEAEILRSPYCHKLALVYDNGPRPIPDYLSQAYDAVVRGERPPLFPWRQPGLEQEDEEADSTPLEARGCSQFWKRLLRRK